MRRSIALFIIFSIFGSVAWFALFILGILLGWFENPLRSLLVGAAPLLAVGIYYNITSSPLSASQSRKRIGGASVDNAEVPQKGLGLLLGTVRLPPALETQHLIMEGANGTGKTQAIKQLISQVLARGDKVVVIDSQYEMHRTFAAKYGGIILSPFDESSPGWLPQNEVRTPQDWNALADTLIAKGEGSGAEWNAMARAFFTAIARGYHREVLAAGAEFDHMALFHLLTSASVEDIAPFLEGSAAASLADNEKGLTNVRMSFFESLAFWPDLKKGDFSVRDWVGDEDRQNLFIPHTKRTLGALRALIATWADQIVQEACDLGEDRDRRVWVIIDELASLGQIPALEEATAELRKTGFCLVVGVQNIEQIEQRYTKTGARTINSNLSSKLFFRVNDPDAAERISKTIGDARHEVRSFSQSSSAQGGSTESVTEQVDRLVLASDIQALDNLHAFVKIAGSDTTYRTIIPIYGKEKK